MKLNFAGAVVAIFMAFGGPSHASILDLDFTINRQNLLTTGVPPLGITQADFPVSGSASFVLNGTQASVRSLDLVIGNQVVEATGIDYLYDGAMQIGLGILSSSPFPFLEVEFVLKPTSTTQFGSFNLGFDTNPTGPSQGRIFCQSCVSTTIVSGPPVLTTPLPNSAPLFGVGLVALCGLGYGLQRRGPGAVSFFSKRSAVC